METPSVTFTDIEAAHERLQNVVRQTPLEFCERLSAHFGARVFLKREDLQIVRSYKIRGAYNRMRQVPEETRSRGVVCASAGNHAQGVAHGCTLLHIPGVIFMPRNTPRQKVARVHALGGDLVRVELGGDTFDDAKYAAQAFAQTHDLPVIAPFDDPHVIAGQGTVAREVWHQLQAIGETQAPVLVAGVGGGGLLAGMSVYLRHVALDTRFFAVEPSGAYCAA